MRKTFISNLIVLPVLWLLLASRAGFAGTTPATPREISSMPVKAVPAARKPAPPPANPLKTDPLLKSLASFLEPLTFKNTFTKKLADTLSRFANSLGQVTQSGAMGLAKFIVAGIKKKANVNQVAALLEGASVITRPDQVPLYNELFAGEGINVQPAGILFQSEDQLNDFLSVIYGDSYVGGIMLDPIEFKSTHLLGKTGLFLTTADPDVIGHEMGHYAQSAYMVENGYNFSVYYKGSAAADNLKFAEQLAEFRPQVVKKDLEVKRACASSSDPEGCFLKKAKESEAETAQAMVAYWSGFGLVAKIAKTAAALIAKLHSFLSTPIIERILFHAKGMADFLRWLKVPDSKLELIRQWVK